MVACHCGGTGDRGLFAPQSSCPRFSLGAGVTPAVHSEGPAPLAMPRHYPYVPGWHVTVVPGATEVAVRAWLEGSEHWGSPCSDDPVSTVGDRGLGRWPRGHVKEGAAPDATGITPSDVSKEGRQGCRREVSAQGGDENPSARSEPTRHHAMSWPSQLSFLTRGNSHDHHEYGTTCGRKSHA